MLRPRRSLFQSDGGCTPTASLRRGIAKVEDEFRASQHGTDNFPLHTDAPAMDDAQGLESQAMGLREVFLHYGLYVSRRHGMQIEDIRDGNPNGFRLHSSKTKKPGQPKPTGPSRLPQTARIRCQATCCDRYWLAIASI
jgi:hypothetical protein